MADAVLGAASALDGADDGGAGGVARWKREVVDDPAFQDHLALPFASQRQVAAWHRGLAEQAELVLERTEALLR